MLNCTGRRASGNWQLPPLKYSFETENTAFESKTEVESNRQGG